MTTVFANVFMMFDLTDNLTSGWRELRAVRLLLERRARDARRRTVGDDRRHGEVFLTEIRVSREMLCEHRVLAVRGAAREQVAAGHVGGDDRKASPCGRRSGAAGGTATTTAATRAGVPGRNRMTLQRALRRSRSRAEMQEARLLAGIHVDLERVVVGPGDIQPARDAQAAARPVGAAWIPWCRRGGRAGRGAAAVELSASAAAHARGRRIRRHALDPVLRDDGDPVTGQV